MANDDLDDLSKFENPETAQTIPAGYLVLFFGLIAWGIYYLWAYSPWGGGWSQAKDLEGTASSATNVFWTIAFTVIPTVAAIGLALVQKSRKKG